MTFKVEWHQSRLVLTFRWVLAFTVMGPAIGGCWAVVTLIFAPVVYAAAPVAAFAGLIYITAVLALEKRKSNSVAARVIIAALAGGVPMGICLSMVGILNIFIIGVISGAAGAIGTAMVLEGSDKARSVFGLPVQSELLYTVDSRFLKK